MKLGELFEIGEKLEYRNAKMYAHFALLHGECDERMANFWEQMSTDEWQHYIVLSFCRDLCETHGYLSKEVPDIDDKSLAEAYRLLDRAEELLQKGEMTLRDSFETAILIEKGETDTIFDILANISLEIVEASEKRFLRGRIERAKKQNEQHEERLLQAVRRFSDDPSLVREAQLHLGPK